MRKILLAIKRWFKYRKECYKITCYLEHPKPAGQEEINSGWFLEMKHKKYELKETYYVGGLLGQNEQSIEWVLKTREEMKERIRLIINAEIV
jgi:hypothetical protein